jgi:parvulin-like peptidyl-prolyl isomerase
MATFENIRKISPFLLGAFAVIFVVFMILQDADISTALRSGNDPQNAVLAEINGKEIKYMDYENNLKEALDQNRAQAEQNKVKNYEANEPAMREQLWNNLVDQMVLKTTAEDLGLVINEEVVADMLQLSPPQDLARSFTDDKGNFARDIYSKVLTNPESVINYMGQNAAKMSQEDKNQVIAGFRKQILKAEENLYIQIAAEHVTAVVNTISAYVSPTYASLRLKQDEETASVNLVSFPIEGISNDKVSVSDDEIAKYYEENKQFYKQRESRKFKYVVLPLKASAQDSIKANNKFNLLSTALASAGENMAAKDSIFALKAPDFNAEPINYTFVTEVDPNDANFIKDVPSKTVVGPFEIENGKAFYRVEDRRESPDKEYKASHILIPFGNNKDSAKAIAQSVLEEVKAGLDFAEAANKYSTDAVANKTGGDLGFFKKEAMVKEFSDAVFAANVGDLLGPVETQFGFHVVKVTDRKADEVKYTKLKINYGISSNTKSDLKRQAASIKSLVEQGGNFEDVAKRNNLAVMETSFFTRFSKALNSNYLTQKAFEEKVGTIFEPREAEGYGILLVQLSAERLAGTIPLEDKKAEIKNILIRRKKLDMMKQVATEASSKLNTGGNIADLAQANGYIADKLDSVKNNGIIPGKFANEIGLTTKFFVSNLNEVSQPQRGENAYFIYQVTNKNVLDDMAVAQKLPEYMQRLRQFITQNSFETWLQYTKIDNIKYTDKRTKMYNDF